MEEKRLKKEEKRLREVGDDAAPMDSLSPCARERRLKVEAIEKRRKTKRQKKKKGKARAFTSLAVG